MEKGTEKAWDVLKDLTDPELPFLTLDDLGVIREITVSYTHLTLPTSQVV